MVRQASDKDGIAPDSSNTLIPDSTVEENKTCDQTPAKLRQWLQDWSLDVASMLFSICCMIGTISLLLAIDGKPLDSWHILQLTLTPNALVSILSTLGKSALLLAVGEGMSQLKWIFFQPRQQTLTYLQHFDDASRGPLGSLRLLWRLRLKACVASLGALITVLAIAVDPFAQQILFYRIQERLVDDNRVSMPVTSKYASQDGGKSPTEPSRRSRHLAEELFPVLTNSAVYEATVHGLYVPHTSITAACPTANCTWPEYKTLAVCTSCRDTILWVAETCVPESNSTKYDANSRHVAGGESYEYGGVMHCTWREELTGRATNVSYMEFTTSDAPTKWSSFGRRTTTDLWMDMDFSALMGTAFNMTLNEFPSTLPWNASDASTMAPVAKTTACDMSFCQKTYGDASSTNGLLEENLMSGEPVLFKQRWCSNTTSTFTTNCAGLLSSQATEKAHLDYESLLDSGEASYWITEYAAGDLWTGVQEAFTEGVSSQAITQLAERALGSAFHGNYSQMLGSVAMAIEKHIRSQPNGTTFPGKAYSPVTLVEVRWPWAVYPTSLVFAAIVFWSFTVAKSARSGALVWKSSCLPLLLHDLEGWEVRSLQSSSIAEMNGAAGRMKRQLVSNGSDPPAFRL